MIGAVFPERGDALQNRPRVLGELACCGMVLLAGCRAPSSCEQLAASEQFEDALSECAAEYELDGKCASGVSAAKAALRLTRYDEVTRWKDRLIDSPCEADGWYLAGEAEYDRERPDRALEAFDRAGLLYAKAERFSNTADSHWWIYYIMRAKDHRSLLEAAAASFEAASRGDDALRSSRALEGLFEVF